MALASGVAKQVRIKKETTYGTPPGAAGAQQMRRVTSDLSLNKDSYQSAEMRSDYQKADMRHGVRRVQGSVNGELSPLSYSALLASALRKDLAAITATSGLTITISGSGPTYILQRSTGSYLTDGFKVGQVRRLTAGGFAAGNLNKNLLVVDVTANQLTVRTLNGSALVAEGPIATATLSFPGKQTFVPQTAHTNDSYAIEHFFADVSQSELFTGLNVNTVAINLPPTGMATINLGFVGKDTVNNNAAYYTSPADAPTTGIVAAVNGLLLVGGSASAICTGLSINIDNGYSGEPVVGSNTIPQQVPGRVSVSGQVTAYFEDAVMRDQFINEVEFGVVVVLTTSNADNADFISFVMPRNKSKSASKDDGEKNIIQTIAFDSLLAVNGGAGAKDEKTTILIQDSAA